MNSTEHSVALAIPDPRHAPIPVGWAEDTFAPLVMLLEWEDLESAEARIRGLASELESLDRDTAELLKAWRMVEARRGEILGIDAHPGQPEKNSPRAVNSLDVSSQSASRYREIARHWEMIWPQIVKETDPKKLSQSAILRIIQEHKSKEVKQAQPSTNGSTPHDNTQSPSQKETAAAKREADAENAAELLSELEEASNRIERLQAENESLVADDAGAEIRKWSARYAQLDGRLQQALTTSSEAQKQAKYRGSILDKLTKLLKVEKYSEIVGAVEALLQ